MKFGNVQIILILVPLLTGSADAVASVASDVNCTPSGVQSQYSSGSCSSPEGSVFPLASGTALPPLFLKQSDSDKKSNIQTSVANKSASLVTQKNKTIIYFFWGKGCPHCEEERQFLEATKNEQPSLEIRDFEVWYNRENAYLLSRMLATHEIKSSGVPVTFIGKQFYSGFSARTKTAIENELNKCNQIPCIDPGDVISKVPAVKADILSPSFVSATSASTGVSNNDTPIAVPLLGEVDVKNSSLPLLTLVIAGMDSFNPCAFFVLLTLLGMLVHARSRNKMLLIGGIFVFFSGFIYFLFMAAWLNLFLVMGHVAMITTIAGFISVIIAVINIKDFFMFKQGVSLSIPDSAKPKLFERMRKLLRSDSLLSMLIGATVLAIVANSYELLCTAGFPMVFTRILTLNSLTTASYYLYLVFYNVVYVVPLFIIVLGFSLTLGSRKLSEWQGRVLKLISGAMMLGLGIVLLINPALLNSVMVSASILLSALVGAFIVAVATKKLRQQA